MRFSLRHPQRGIHISVPFETTGCFDRRSPVRKDHDPSGRPSGNADNAFRQRDELRDSHRDATTLNPAALFCPTPGVGQVPRNALFPIQSR